MAHLVSSVAFRSGKTFLWPNSDSGPLLGNSMGLSIGVSNSLDYFLRQQDYFMVRSSSSTDNRLGVTNVKLLYYPLINPILRQRLFPTFLTQRQLLDFTFRNRGSFNNSIKKLWVLKRFEFANRFTAPKIRRQLNKWLTVQMFRGSSAQIKLRTKQPSRYYRPKSAKQAWQSSTNYLSPNVLSRLVSLRLGKRIIVRPYNVFSYLSNKLGKLTYKNHQTHVWGKYHKQKKYFHSYYDLVNSLFVLAYIPFSERLVIAIIQYALIRMHRRKVKPKRLFVLIDQIINEMPVIRQNFHACRVVITGKVKGGKARTSSLSAGFGVLPKQSLTENIRFDFGDVRSKYGAFGVNMLTWRK